MPLLPRLTAIIAFAIVFYASWYLLLPATSTSSYLLNSNQSGPKRLSSTKALSATKLSATQPLFKSYWVSGAVTNESHSANITIQAGRPVAVWYGGTEEGAADVAVYISVFSQPTSTASTGNPGGTQAPLGVARWSEPIAIINREQTQSDLYRYVRKIGNPTLHTWPDGSIGIYYVSVSMGGWAASSLNYLELNPSQIDRLASGQLLNTESMLTSPARRLVTSPFLNISTLVRATAVAMQDGSITLPVYHEFMGKFSETLRLDRQQRILNKTRLSWGRYSLQPTLAAISETEALALTRDSGEPPGRVLMTQTHETGISWSQPVKLDIANPNSAIALLNIGHGRLLAALNDTEDGRFRLSLAMASTDDPHKWRVIKTIESEETADPTSHKFEFSYPSMVQADDGVIHLVYTWNQTRVKHVMFNDSWLLDL